MKATTYQFAGLEYIRVSNIPLKRREAGTVIAMDLFDIERLVATEIVRRRFPIRGIEVKFFRKHLGLSLKKFGGIFHVSDVAVLKWEKKPESSLEFSSEIAMRAFMAEQLGIPFVGALSALETGAETPKRPVIVGAA